MQFVFEICKFETEVSLKIHYHWIFQNLIKITQHFTSIPKLIVGILNLYDKLYGK